MNRTLVTQMTKSNRFEMAVPPVLKKRIEEEISHTGQKMSEFFREAAREKLEVQEKSRAEMRLVEDAVKNGMSA